MADKKETRLCQSCGQRPASIKLREVINGQPHEMAICYQCATERSVFGNGFPTGMFDAFFGQQFQNKADGQNGQGGQQSL